MRSAVIFYRIFSLTWLPLVPTFATGRIETGLGFSRLLRRRKCLLSLRFGLRYRCFFREKISKMTFFFASMVLRKRFPKAMYGCKPKGATHEVASYADALWARHAIFLPHERLLKRMGCLIRPITADFPIKAAHFEP